MSHTDSQFMKEMGIEPCHLDDPAPSSLPPPLPPEAQLPSLTEADARWLLNLGVILEEDPEPGFVLPKTLQEYLARYPGGIREATGKAAEELGLDFTEGYLDGLALEILKMFLGFEKADLEDIVEMYAYPPPMPPERYMSVRFHGYIRHRVRAALPVVLGNMRAEGR